MSWVTGSHPGPGGSDFTSRQDSVMYVVTVKTELLKDALCVQVRAVQAERRCCDG